MIAITARILQLLETLYAWSGASAARPRTSVAIYRGGPPNYGVGKNYTTVFIIPCGAHERGWRWTRWERMGHRSDRWHPDDTPVRGWPSSSDRRSTPPGYENFQANSAGKVGHFASRFGGFGRFESLAEVSTAALDFDSECPELTPQNG